MAKPAVFVDSSVIITALLSSTGGSFYLLTQCQEFFVFHINEYVLLETQEILRTKFAKQPSLMTDLFRLLGTADVAVLSDPPKREVMQAAKVISENDAPILASALRSCDYLVTLDNEFHAEPIRSVADKQSLAIVKPKDLIEELRENEAA